jgi:hypothetical protein
MKTIDHEAVKQAIEQKKNDAAERGFGCELIFWVRTPSDSRHYAGGTGAVYCQQKHANRIAKDIDSSGQPALDRAIADGHCEKPHTMSTGKAAAGHGVTIIYPSGTRREVRHD